MKNEKIREKRRKEEISRENAYKYVCNTICKAVHIKLIYVLAISTQYI